MEGIVQRDDCQNHHPEVTRTSGGAEVARVDVPPLGVFEDPNSPLTKATNLFIIERRRLVPKLMKE